MQFLQTSQNLNYFLVLFFFFWIFAVLGSYLNVVVSRGFKKSLNGRSRCDHCKKGLEARYMVPVFSSLYLILFNKTQTKCCSKGFSKKYLVTEIFAGLIGVFSGIIYINRGLETLLILLPFVTIFLLLALQDFWEYEIDVMLAIVMIILLFLGFLMLPGRMQQIFVIDKIDQGLQAGWIFTAGIIVIILLSKGRGIGTGDIFLLFFIGASLGVAIGIIAIQITIYSAAITGILYALLKRKFKGLIVPLAPFLFLGWLVVLAFLPDFQNIVRSIILIWTF